MEILIIDNKKYLKTQTNAFSPFLDKDCQRFYPKVNVEIEIKWDQFIKLLESNKFNFIAFDHDLNEFKNGKIIEFGLFSEIKLQNDTFFIFYSNRSHVVEKKLTEVPAVYCNNIFGVPRKVKLSYVREIDKGKYCHWNIIW